MNLKTLTTATLLLTGVGLIGLAPRDVHADPSDGSQMSSTTVVHGTDDLYHIKYNGGEQGDVHVVPDEDSDTQYLEIKVYDPEGNLVTRDFGDADPSLHCAFFVDERWEWRRYTIKVVNLSYHSILYTVRFF